LLKVKILKNTLLYMASNYVAMALGIAASLLSKMLLGVAGAGQWTFFKTCSSYAEYADLGIKDAMLREVPQARGSGREGDVPRIMTTAFYFIGFSACCTVLVFLMIGFARRAEPSGSAGFVLAGALAALTQLYNLGIVILRVEKRMEALSGLVVLNMVFFLCFALAGARWFGVEGMLAGASAATLCSLIFVGIFWRPDLTVAPSWKVIAGLVRTGLPMVALGYLLAAFLTIDSILIAKFIGFEALGLYSIGIMAVQQIGSIGRFAQIVSLPYLQEKYASPSGTPAEMTALYSRFTGILAHYLPFLIAAVGFGVPVLVHYLLNKFEGGVGSMKILALGYFFIASGEISTTILFTMNKQKKLILPMALFLGMEAAVIAWAASTGGTIQTVALVTAAAYAAAFTLIYFECFLELEPFRAAWGRYVRIWVIFLYLAAVFTAADRWIEIRWVWLEGLLKCGAVWAAWFPFWLRFERKEPIAGPMLKMLRISRS
jgi:O-antigen/teichoic acid export membrane protein